MGIWTVLWGHNKDSNEVLKQKFLDALNLKGEFGKGIYWCIEEKAMVGCLILGFCKELIIPWIWNIQTSKVKTAFKGKAGNKGSVLIWFELDDTSIVMSNCHLESGQKNSQVWVQNLKDAMDQAFDEMGCLKQSFESHDVKMVFGDLNFRIDCTY